MQSHSRALLLLLLLAAAACSSDVGGSWTGTWSGVNSSGSIRFDLRQNGSEVTGVAVMTGSSCLAGGAVTATVDGDTLSGSVASGAVKWMFDGTVSNDDRKMGGTFTFAGACAGQTGGWEAAK